jgi:hypothetical protein
MAASERLGSRQLNSTTQAYSQRVDAINCLKAAGQSKLSANRQTALQNAEAGRKKRRSGS